MRANVYSPAEPRRSIFKSNPGRISPVAPLLAVVIRPLPELSQVTYQITSVGCRSAAILCCWRSYPKPPTRKE